MRTEDAPRYQAERSTRRDGWQAALEVNDFLAKE
jgi:hypothetical protein